MVYQAYDKFIRSPKSNTPESKPTAGHAYKGYKKPEAHVEKNDVNNNNSCIWNQQFEMAIAGTLASNIIGLAGNAIGQLLNGGQEYADYEDMNVQNTPNTETETETEKEETVKNLLNSKGISTVSEDMLNDLVKKYDAYRNVYPDWTEEQLANRLVSYRQALITKDMMYASDQNTLDNNTAHSIENPEITNALKNNDITQYQTALMNFGQGIVDTYDTNNDGLVDAQEFTSQQRKLDIDNIEVFKKLDINTDNVLDAAELGAHYYSVSRMLDNVGQTVNSKAEESKTGNNITVTEYNAAKASLNGTGGNQNYYSNLQSSTYVTLNTFAFEQLKQKYNYDENNKTLTVNGKNISGIEIRMENSKYVLTYAGRTYEAANLVLFEEYFKEL